MEDQQEDVDALLAHLANMLEMKDIEPHKIASMFAITMYEEFTRNGIKEQIDTAISFAQISLRYEHNNPEITNSLLNNLGVFLESRYERVGDMADLEEAIQVARRAVALTPGDHSDLAVILNSLGNKLERRYKRTGDMADLEEANRVFARSWTSYSSAPFTRIFAASRCLKMIFHLEQYDEAAEIAVSVTDLLPIVNTRSLDRNDRQHVMSRFAGIAADACGVLLQARDPETALQYLEKGRAVILGQIIDNWSDLSSLMKAHPELSRDLRRPCRVSKGHHLLNKGATGTICLFCVLLHQV
jgi:tetratricopeptide (TPR) repeat protein